VRWRKEITLPEIVVNNLSDFMGDAKSAIFEGVRSKHVNLFLSEVMPELTAKVFRTFHASEVVKSFLSNAKISESDPDFVKKHIAKMANLQAAIICNHKSIDPRIYYDWGKKVEFDWKLHYPKALQRKFSWVERDLINS